VSKDTMTVESAFHLVASDNVAYSVLERGDVFILFTFCGF
jgi:hypothetical protein